MKGSKDIKNIVEENKNIEVEKIENTYYANISYIEGNKILEIIEKPYIKSLEKNLQNLNLHISKIRNTFARPPDRIRRPSLLHIIFNSNLLDAFHAADGKAMITGSRNCSYHCFILLI